MTAIASVLTIPVTTTVCTRGAVIFTQKGHTSLDLTLRRTLTLADRGWTDILILGSLTRSIVSRLHFTIISAKQNTLKFPNTNAGQSDMSGVLETFRNIY